jgi:GAF domain-containing protein
MTTGLPLADELAAVFARMSGLLLTDETVATALTLTTSLAKETFDGTSGAGVSLLDENGRRVTAAATDDVVERADELQYRLAQGPCLTAWEDRTVVRVDDITEDRRWPRWTEAMGPDVGLRSILSAPLVAGGTGLGALKLYAREPYAYGDREEYLLAMFAAQAAVLLANVKSYQEARAVSDRLKQAFRGRDLINVAKGVIMAREATDEQTAFMLLTAMANEQHKPLRDVAAGVAQSTIRPGR